MKKKKEHTNAKTKQQLKTIYINLVLNLLEANQRFDFKKWIKDD